ncbi:HEAT repeat domain-containing protein [Polaromonas sp.]|uniref:HEAT repeat domain-containing protein n=1 Tax=Polaromonas sp. TaxID=1869339 RepID=UPI00286B9B2C|nr:HEAT repeat domain-containing protein [Polaromonas sp.]
MLNTFSDPYAAFALRVGIAAIGLTLLLVLVIVFLRLWLRRNLRREKAFIAVWRPLLLEAVSEAQPNSLPVLQARDRLFFLKLWNYLQESLRGSASDRLNELARRLKCDVAARGYLKKGRRAERLLAILTLGHLRDSASWEELADQATRPDSLASIHAARAMTRIDPLPAIDRLLPLLLARDDWGITQVAGFLAEARPAFGLHLTKNIRTMNQRHWPRALQLADALRLELPPATMQFILGNSRSVEALVAALRLASGLPLLPTVRRFLRHPDWRVRVEVARCLGNFGDRGDLLLLQHLLEDKHWWVRYRAAQSLASMPFFGPEELRALRAKTDDALARDMLDQVLAERHAIPA